MVKRVIQEVDSVDKVDRVDGGKLISD